MTTTRDNTLFLLAQKHSGTIRALEDEDLARLFRENHGKPIGALFLAEALYRGETRNKSAGGYRRIEDQSSEKNRY